MKPFGEATPRAQATRLRPLALEALRIHGIRSTRVRLIQHGENTTFRVDGDESFVVRVHRLGYRTGEEIASELEFLRALADDGDVRAPVPHRAPDGRWGVTVDGRGLDGPRIVTIMHWMHGRHRFVDSATTLAKMGALTARLHRFARRWSPPPGFRRPDYRIDAQMRSEPTVHAIEEVPGLSRTVRERLVEAREAIVAECAPLESEPRAVLPLHADLHLGNVVYSDGSVCPIDFDDLAIGHPVADAAVTVGLARLAHREAYFAGYRSVAPFPDEWVRALPAYAFGRRVRMLGWNSFRAGTMPALADRIPMLVDLALLVDRWRRTGDEHDAAEIRSFLERGSD